MEALYDVSYDQITEPAGQMEDSGQVLMALHQNHGTVGLYNLAKDQKQDLF
jgi:hypothetical protein